MPRHEVQRLLYAGGGCLRAQLHVRQTARRNTGKLLSASCLPVCGRSSHGSVHGCDLPCVQNVLPHPRDSLHKGQTGSFAYSEVKEKIKENYVNLKAANVAALFYLCKVLFVKYGNYNCICKVLFVFKIGLYLRNYVRRLLACKRHQKAADQAGERHALLIGQKAQQSVSQEASDTVVDTISVPQIIIDESQQQQQSRPTTNVVKPRRPGSM